MFPGRPSQSDPRYAVWPGPYNENQQPIYNNNQPFPRALGGPYFNQPVQQYQNMMQPPNQNRIQQGPPRFLNIMNNPMFPQNSRFPVTAHQTPAQFITQQQMGFPITAPQTPAPFMNQQHSQFPTTPLTPVQQIYQQHTQSPVTAPHTPAPFLNQQNSEFLITPLIPVQQIYQHNSQFPITPQTPAAFMHENNPLESAARFPGQYTNQPNLHYFTPVPPAAPPAGQCMNQGVQQPPNTSQQNQEYAHNSCPGDFQDPNNAQPTDRASTPMLQGNENDQTPQNNVPNISMQPQPLSGHVSSGEVIQPPDDDMQNEVKVKKTAFKFSPAAKPFVPVTSGNSRQQDPLPSNAPIQPAEETLISNPQHPSSPITNQVWSSFSAAMSFDGQPTPPLTRPTSRQGPVNEPSQLVNELLVSSRQSALSSMADGVKPSSSVVPTLSDQTTPPATETNSHRGPVNAPSEQGYETPVCSQQSALSPTANELTPSSSSIPTLADEATQPLARANSRESENAPLQSVQENSASNPADSPSFEKSEKMKEDRTDEPKNEVLPSSSVVPTLADQATPPLPRANSKDPENAPVQSVQVGSVSNLPHYRTLAKKKRRIRQPKDGSLRSFSDVPTLVDQTTPSLPRASSSRHRPSSEQKNVRKGRMGKRKNEGTPEQSRDVRHRLISESDHVNEALEQESQTLESRSGPPSVLPSSQQPELSRITEKAPSVINDTSHQFKSSRYFNNRRDTAESLEYANRRPSTIRDYTAGELLSLLPLSTGESTHSDRRNASSATHSPHLTGESLQSWDDLVISLADSLHMSDDFRTHNEATMRDTTSNPIDAAAPTDKPASPELPVSRIVKQASSNGYPRTRRPKNFCNMTIPPPLTAYDHLDKHVIAQEQLYILCTCEARERQHVLNKLLAIKETEAPQMADMLQQHPGTSLQRLKRDRNDI
jgi:hypothetical protein